MEKLYNPKAEERFGYMYQVEICEEALLTYEQALKREYGRDICTTDPDDSTDYDAMKWYKVGSLIFAKKEWEQLIFEIRRHLKMRGPLLECKDDFDRQYYYYFDEDYRLKEKVLKRASIHITHRARIEFDEGKFAKHLLTVNRA